jgi:hypothetical protein
VYTLPHFLMRRGHCDTTVGRDTQPRP